MFRLSSALFAVSLVIVGGLAVPSHKRDSISDQVTALKKANTADDRYQILGPSGLLFSFLDAPSFGGGGKGMFFFTLKPVQMKQISLNFLRCRWWSCSRRRYRLAWGCWHGNFSAYGIHGCKSTTPKTIRLNNYLYAPSLAASSHLISIQELQKS